MNKELIDKAWACLPRDFKEKVKFEYHRVATKARKEEYDLGFMHAHEGMFGIHNLTSDAEGEEMLTAMKWKVQEQYANYNKELKHDGLRHIEYEKAKEVVKVLYYLFGSKCLPDDGDNLSPETKPAEPKFKVGDKVRIKGCGYEPNLHKGDIGEILDTNDKEQCFVLFKKSQAWIYIDCLEPYTEPTANYMQVDYHGADTAASTIADSCQSQPVTDYFDRIIKDGFRGHNRLHIAAQIVASMIGSDDWTTWRGGSNKEIWHNMAKSSLEIADALIAEAEKGGSK